MTGKRLIRVLSRHWLLITVLTALTVAATGVLSSLQAKRYEATALMQVQAPPDAEGTIQLQGTLSARERAVTIATLGNTDAIDARVARALPAGTASYSCNFAQRGQSEFIAVTCSSGQRRQVARVANAYAAALQGLLEQQRLARTRESLRQYRAELRQIEATGASLRDAPTPPAPSIRELERIDAATTPTFASDPKPLRNMAVVLVLGLIVNIGLAFALELVQDRAHEPDDVADAVGQPILATVPVIRRARSLLGPSTAEPLARLEAPSRGRERR